MLVFRSQCKKVCCCNFFKSRQSLGWVVCGGQSLPVLDSNWHLGIEFSSDGSWDKYIKSLVVQCVCNKQKLGGLYEILHNFAFDLKTRRHILMAVLRPSWEYHCEVWNTNECQAKALESIQLRACKYAI